MRPTPAPRSSRRADRTRRPDRPAVPRAATGFTTDPTVDPDPIERASPPRPATTRCSRSSANPGPRADTRPAPLAGSAAAATEHTLDGVAASRFHRSRATTSVRSRAARAGASLPPCRASARRAWSGPLDEDNGLLRQAVRACPHLFTMSYAAGTARSRRDLPARRQQRVPRQHPIRIACLAAQRRPNIERPFTLGVGAGCGSRLSSSRRRSTGSRVPSPVRSSLAGAARLNVARSR